MIMDLPIFFPDNKRYAEEAQKGINLRFLNANNKELGCISRMAVPGKATGVNTFCKNNPKIHIGIGLFDSEEIKNLSNLPNSIFLLFAPLASADRLENVFQLTLSTWEPEAIKRYLGHCEIDSNEIKIVTNLDATSSYLKPFLSTLLKEPSPKKKGKKTVKKPTNESLIIINQNIDDETTSKLIDTAAIIVIAEEKWKTFRKFRELEKLEKKVVITTSSIEDWQVPPPIRKMFAKWVVYTYPRFAGNSENIINQFEQKFGYKPSIYSLLAYDAADIAMKALSNAGPVYEAMKQYLEVTEFDTITMGKIGFGENSNPYLIGRNSETLFDIKYIDSKGRYRNEQVES